MTIKIPEELKEHIEIIMEPSFDSFIPGEVYYVNHDLCLFSTNKGIDVPRWSPIMFIEHKSINSLPGMFFLYRDQVLWYYTSGFLHSFDNSQLSDTVDDCFVWYVK